MRKITADSALVISPPLKGFAYLELCIICAIFMSSNNLPLLESILVAISFHHLFSDIRWVAQNSQSSRFRVGAIETTLTTVWRFTVGTRTRFTVLGN